MRSMVLTEYERLELEDVPMPELGPEDVRVRGILSFASLETGAL